MRITIDQAEIETAIKNHISNLITIKEGQDISIDLKAGRGENGFSAEISIDKPAEPVTEPKATTRTRQAAAPVEQVKAEPEVQVQEVAETATESPVVEQPSEPVDEVQTGAEAPAEVPVAEEAAPSRPAGSLFAGLNRPKND